MIQGELERLFDRGPIGDPELAGVFVFEQQSIGLASEFEQDGAWFEAGGDAFVIGGIGREIADAPEAAFEAEARGATGCGDAFGFERGEPLGGAVHAGLTTREGLVGCGGRVWGERLEPIGEATGVEQVEGAFEVGGSGNDAGPAVAEVWGGFERAEGVLGVELSEAAEFFQDEAF